mmetsp:Transcript_7655/g.18126  ORF Transcript_7655/g.18126 Transcript_7655/m.18126 type:complete len:303 (+) Transcript_7655:563-1471(+)
MIATAGGAEETIRQALVQRGEDACRGCAGDRVTHHVAAHVRLHDQRGLGVDGSIGDLRPFVERRLRRRLLLLASAHAKEVGDETTRVVHRALNVAERSGGLLWLPFACLALGLLHLFEAGEEIVAAAPRRAAHLLLGQPLLVLLVLVLTQHPAVERTAALGAPHLAAALGAADGIPFVRRDQQTARVRRSHLTAPLGPEEVGPMRLLLRLDELLRHSALEVRLELGGSLGGLRGCLGVLALAARKVLLHAAGELVAVLDERRAVHPRRTPRPFALRLGDRPVEVGAVGHQPHLLLRAALAPR